MKVEKYVCKGRKYKKASILLLIYSIVITIGVIACGIGYFLAKVLQ